MSRFLSRPLLSLNILGEPFHYRLNIFDADHELSFNITVHLGQLWQIAINTRKLFSLISVVQYNKWLRYISAFKIKLPVYANNIITPFIYCCQNVYIKQIANTIGCFPLTVCRENSVQPAPVLFAQRMIYIPGIYFKLHLYFCQRGMRKRYRGKVFNYHSHHVFSVFSLGIHVIPPCSRLTSISLQP